MTTPAEEADFKYEVSTQVFWKDSAEALGAEREENFQKKIIPCFSEHLCAYADMPPAGIEPTITP